MHFTKQYKSTINTLNPSTRFSLSLRLIIVRKQDLTCNFKELLFGIYIIILKFLKIVLILLLVLILSLKKPILTDMTPYDLNFVDEVECLLRAICDPAYRSLVVETMMVIAVILQRNTELSFDEVVDIKLIIMDAINAFKRDRHTNM